MKNSKSEPNLFRQTITQTLESGSNPCLYSVDDLTNPNRIGTKHSSRQPASHGQDPILYIPFIKRHHRPCGVIWLTHNPHSEDAPQTKFLRDLFFFHG
ncbi:hypothetical protein CDAR_608081 [Caerostris darwini]|uniref:Uncharacterized protein n=1 Tax=Caerostris darwini TaxID=1538125 RepID=A0AAV4Q1B0_9ARAC|nr:hypothetical protein CDAR_608081 [Caerostris darwini]